MGDIKGRQKLEGLGIKLPLLPTTSVGSFPKPERLKKARTYYSKGKITKGDLKEKELEATAFWIRFQEDIGIDVLVDGEMYRGDMVAYFAEELAGFERGKLVRSYGNRYYHKPVIVGPVRWKGPITVDWWKFAQSQTTRPLKGMLTGPYTMMDWSFNEYYPDRRSAAVGLAHEIRKEVEALIQAGAKIIQIDEPALSVRTEELPIAIEAMQIITDGLPAYFITHICYGTFEYVYPEVLKMPVDNIDLDMTSKGESRLELMQKESFTKDISYGVVDVHSHVVEEVSEVQRRIQRAAQVLPVESIWVDPDCGLKTRQVEEAQAKLQIIVQAVQQLRSEELKGQ
jgi:5-methyltetrahydropteroyltriglutamate--homocysteine methyltransferase